MNNFCSVLLHNNTLKVLVLSFLLSCTVQPPMSQNPVHSPLAVKMAQPSPTQTPSFQRHSAPTQVEKSKYILLKPTPQQENFRTQEFLAAPYIPEEYSNTVGTQWGDGDLRWRFRVMVPSSRPTTIIITLTGNEACQSVFDIRQETFPTLNPESTG